MSEKLSSFLQICERTHNFNDDKNLLLSILYKRVNPSKADEASVVRSDVTMKKILRCMVCYFDSKIDNEYKYKAMKRTKKEFSFISCCDMLVVHKFDQDLIKLMGLQNSAIANSLAALIQPKILVKEIDDSIK